MRALKISGVLLTPDELFAFLNVLNQTLTLTHLVRRQGVAFIRKRVFPFLELNTDRRTHHVQRLTEVVHQIALVGVRQILNLITVDHHDRRVIPPGVGILQLHATATHQRRLSMAVL